MLSSTQQHLPEITSNSSIMKYIIANLYDRVPSLALYGTTACCPIMYIRKCPLEYLQVQAANLISFLFSYDPLHSVSFFHNQMVNQHTWLKNNSAHLHSTKALLSENTMKRASTINPATMKYTKERFACRKNQCQSVKSKCVATLFISHFEHIN